MENAGRTINNLDKAAILLMSMGEKDAAEVLKQMGPKEVQRVGAAMSQLSSVTQDTVSGVLNQFMNECGAMCEH